MLLVFVIAPLLLLKACGVFDGAPSDAAMAREFAGHRQEFDTLLAMVREEKRVTRVAPDFIWIDGAGSVAAADRARYLPDARLARYRSLFETLDLQAGVVRREDGSVGFLRAGGGIVTSGWSKEFVWSPGFKEPAIGASDPRRVEDLCMPKTRCFSARQLAPDWYIGFVSN